jgi:hypothetical protein
MQVPASWGIYGLNANTARSLYDKANAHLGGMQPTPEQRQLYLDEYFQANAAAGVEIVDGPQVSFHVWRERCLSNSLAKNAVLMAVPPFAPVQVICSGAEYHCDWDANGELMHSVAVC